MLTMHITEADAAVLTAADPGRPDGLVACLAHYGVAPDVIQTALATLAQGKTVVLCQPSAADAWEMQARTP